MALLKAVVLGIVQGLTEFLPVSSSAHLVLVPWMLQWDDPVLESLTFDVILHLGTLVALLTFFASDWRKLIRAGIASVLERKIGDDLERRMAWYLIIGTIPAGIAGLLFEHKIEVMFHQTKSSDAVAGFHIMAAVIALLGTLMWLADELSKHQRKLTEFRLRDCILIGLAQALAIFPGVSRSGSTITAGLALGFERAAAARYSFLLSVPITAAVCLKGIFQVAKRFHAGDLAMDEFGMYAAGLLASFITGYIAIKFLLQFLQRYSTAVFAIYRWLLAALLIWIAYKRS